MGGAGGPAMVTGINRVILLGFVATTPEVGRTGTGDARLSFDLSVPSRFMDRSSEWCNRTDRHQVTTFGARAEGLAPLLRVGAFVLIEGSLTSRSYVDRRGIPRCAPALSVASVSILADGEHDDRTEPAEHQETPCP